jgi:outer membrane biosynthesis protein TonB
MRPANEANNKKTNPNPKSKEPKQEASQQRTDPKPKAKRSKKKDPRKQAKEELKQQPPNRRHTTNWVPVPLFQQRPMTGLASSARRADTTFDVAEWADRRVLSPVAFEDRWRDLIGACKKPHPVLSAVDP